MCEQLGLQPVPATQVLARDRHAEVLRLRVARRDGRVIRAGDPPLAAHRGARGGGAVSRRRAEGFERDAAQAQSGEIRAALRARARAAGDLAGRARERRAVARARHLALVGRTRDPSRLADARVLRARSVHDRRRWAASCIPSACGATSTRRTGSCSASRCCSRSWRPAWRATTRTGWCSASDAGVAGGRAVRDMLAEDPDVTGGTRRDRARRLLRSEARARNTAGRSTRWTGLRNWEGRDRPLPHLYTGKVRDLYEVDHDRLLMVASDRVSVFDVVLPDPIPDKGLVLTGLSTFWFEQTARPVPNHVVSSDPPTSPRRRARDRGPSHARAGDAAAPARVRRARLPVRLRVGRVRGPGHGRRVHGARRVCTKRSVCPSRSSRRPPRPSPATTRP